MTEAELRSILREELKTIESKINGIPLLAASFHELRKDVRGLRGEMRMIRAAINDVARDSVTPGEVEALHDDLNTVLDEHVDIRARLAVLEGIEP